MEVLLINFGFLQDLVLLSPSMKFSCLLYLPIYLVTQFFHIALRFEVESTALPLKLAVVGIMCTIILLQYYLLTIWDLKRFFDMKKSIKYEKQLERVLNFYNDAAVVLSLPVKED